MSGNPLRPQRVRIIRIELAIQVLVAVALAVVFAPFWLVLLLLPIIDFAIRPSHHKRQLLGLGSS